MFVNARSRRWHWHGRGISCSLMQGPDGGIGNGEGYHVRYCKVQTVALAWERDIMFVNARSRRWHWHGRGISCSLIQGPDGGIGMEEGYHVR